MNCINHQFVNCHNQNSPSIYIKTFFPNHFSTLSKLSWFFQDHCTITYIHIHLNYTSVFYPMKWMKLNIAQETALSVIYYLYQFALLSHLHCPYSFLIPRTGNFYQRLHPRPIKTLSRISTLPKLK